MDEKKIEQACIKANEMIDELSMPDQMTSEEAIAFYETLQLDLDGKIEGCQTDVQNENRK